MRKDFEKSYQFFIDTYGIESQYDMCIEEMSELTKELVKLRRYQKLQPEKVADTIKNIQEELADVSNIVEELKMHFGSDEIEKIREQKIERAITRYNNSKRS